MLSLFLILIVSYLVGSFPTSIVVSRLVYGVDIRTQGSKNAGGTNVFRSFGWKPGTFVMAIDILKGVIATLFISQIRIGGSSPIPIDAELVPFMAGIAAILGHIWTIFAGFKGGKGVGTAAGVFAALFPIPTLVCFLVWGVIVIFVRIVSVASMAAAICLPISLFVMEKCFDQPVHDVLFYFSVLLAVLIVFTHRTNIKRLLNGTENRFNPIWNRKKEK